MHKTLMFSLGAVVGFVLVARAVPAQSVLLEQVGPPLESFATDAHWAGDVNRDGHDDFWVSSPLYSSFPSSGKLTLLSGRDGTVLRTLLGTQTASLSSLVFAVAGDLDGDGTRDLLLCQPGYTNGAGRCRVVSGVDGAERYVVYGWPGSNLGASVAPLGDLDGDGISDFAVGLPFSPRSSDFGRVYVRSGRNGAPIREYVSPLGGAAYGGGLRGVGDVNGDGVEDLAIGTASVAPTPGVVHIMSGRDGATLYTFNEPRPTLGFGSRLAGVGDLDGDGRAEFALGRGATFDIVRGGDGSVLRTHPMWQTSIAGGHDLDFDGVPDYVVGEYDPLNYANLRGALHYFSGRTGAVMTVIQGDQAGDQLGRYIHFGGDLNGDGMPDLVTGSPFARQQLGLLRVYGRVAGRFRSFGIGCAGTVGLPTIGVLAPPRIGASLHIRVTNVRSLQPGVLVFGASDTAWGTLPLPAPLGAVGMTGCTLLVSAEILEGVSTGLGTVQWSGFIPNEASLVGCAFFNQCLVLDPGVNPLGIVSSDAGASVIGG